MPEAAVAIQGWEWQEKWEERLEGLLGIGLLFQSLKVSPLHVRLYQQDTEFQHAECRCSTEGSAPARMLLVDEHVPCPW